VSLVLASALSPELKFTAVTLASYANDEGFRIWPSVGEVAYLRGLKERAIQYQMKELRQMHVLEIVKPASRWFPAQYRMRPEALPARPPYQPPDRQPFMLDPIGESPPGISVGVQPAAPLLGVQFEALGVHPGAPDPSLDPPLRTHTTGAREGDTPKSATPDGGESRGARLPLIVAPARDPDHTPHGWCGRICVPKFLHKQFKKALGGPVAKRAIRMRAFYTETIAALPASLPIGDDPVTFWRRAFAARFTAAAPRRGGPVPSAPAIRSVDDEAALAALALKRATADADAEHASAAAYAQLTDAARATLEHDARAELAAFRDRLAPDKFAHAVEQKVRAYLADARVRQLFVEPRSGTG